MSLFFAVFCVFAALPSVLSKPFPVDKRAPGPTIFSTKDLAYSAAAVNLTERGVTECQAANAVVNALNVTSIITPAAVSVTATVTAAPVTVTSQAATTVTSALVSSTTTIYSHYTPGAAKEKRAAPTLPAYISAFGAAQVSTACSCLSIPTSTTIVTTTISTTLPTSTATVSTVTAAAPTATVVSTPTSFVAGATATIPALCAPSNILQTFAGLQYPGELNNVVQSGTADLTSCCVACLDTTNCLSYFMSSDTCVLSLGTATQSPNIANQAQTALCPLGVSSQDTLFGTPQDPELPQHVGPCVVNAQNLI